MFETLSAVDWLILVIAFASGGLYKGLTGVGLPTVSIPILATVFPVSQSLALVVVPILLSNIFQAVASRAEFRAAIAHWPILAALGVGLIFGVIVLDSTHDDEARLMLGAVLLGFGVFSMLGIRPRVPAHRRRTLDPAVGLCSGLIGGLTSIYGWPIVMYLRAASTPHQVFVPTMALVFLTGHFIFTVALASFSILGPLEFALSSLATIPTFAGVFLGRRILRTSSQQTFNRLVDGILILGGLYMFATVYFW